MRHLITLIDETRESIFSSDLLQDQLRRMWDALLGRFRSAEGLRFLALDGEEGARRTIRGVYQQLLAATAAAGQPHRAAQTPGEYADQLSGQWGDPAAISQITERYQQARYAAEAPPSAAAAEVEQAWEKIKGQLGENSHTDKTA